MRVGTAHSAPLPILGAAKEVVDARDKPGHDDACICGYFPISGFSFRAAATSASRR
jgi:hypothetical protein